MNSEWVKKQIVVEGEFDINLLISRGLLIPEKPCLQDASKLHLIFIWVLSSQLDNKIPNNSAWVKQQIGATEDVDLNLFIKHGFLVPWVDPLVKKEDTETLAECLQDASTLHTNADSETEAETEAETYKQEAYKQETETEEHGISKPKKQKKEKTYGEDDRVATMPHKVITRLDT